MKPYFQTCGRCGSERGLSELEHLGYGFLTCVDLGQCDQALQEKAKSQEQALVKELARVEARRVEVLTLIAAIRGKHKLPDPVLDHHKAEMARIDAEE